MRVAIATCLSMPEPDPDEALLLSALEARGVAAKLLAWDDAGAPWDLPQVTVLRSTWNYHHHRDRFVAWAERVAARGALFNPASIVRYNSHKSYLRDLSLRGIAVVPTEWMDRGGRASLPEVMDARGWRDVVVKPAVSAGSYATRRFRRDAIDADYVADLVRERDVMVQPYVTSVDGYGERSIVVVDGEITHAIRKTPRFSGSDEAVSDAMPIADDEREMARATLARVHAKELLYARVDMARADDGSPLLMELELIEPSLFLKQSPLALDRLVNAIARLAKA